VAIHRHRHRRGRHLTALLGQIHKAHLRVPSSYQPSVVAVLAARLLRLAHKRNAIGQLPQFAVVVNGHERQAICGGSFEGRLV
jgi:hypothetical protein